MYNESPLIRRQWEILYKANTLISTYERNIAELEAMFASKQEEAKQKYEYLTEEYTKREREIEQRKRETEIIAAENSIKKATSFMGISQTQLSSKKTPIKQIDDLLEQADKEYRLLASSLREDPKKSQASCLFWLTALTVIIAVFIYSFTYPSYSFDSSGIYYFGLFSFLFFICGIAIRFSRWADRRNHYTAILLALDSARTILQEQVENEKSKNTKLRSQQEHDANTKYNELGRKFISGFAQLNKYVTDYIQSVGLVEADWQDALWKQWQPSITPPLENIIRCGKVTVSYLQQRTESFPLFIPFPARKSLLLQASRDSYEQAAIFLQSLLLRLVTTQLPGMMRFTFFDPLNFGQYVAPFMQLTAYDPTLVGNDIWTESSDIEKHLAALSKYLAQVNQQYLWGATPTIEEYNQQNPQHQLPYRILVVQGFPFKFSPEAVRTLLTIARNGPRCGVYAIILCDMEQLALSGITLDNLNQIALTLRWEGQQVYWDGLQSELQAYSIFTL